MEDNVLVFIPTNKCNLTCEYCLHHIADEYPRNPCDKMSIETLDSIIHKYRSTAISVHFTGGEPFLAPDLLKHYLLNYPEFRTRIFTNGTIVPEDPTLLQLIADFPQLEFNLSIDNKDSVPPLYNFYADSDIHLYGAAVIDESSIDKNIETFHFLNSLKLHRFILSPNYLSPNTQDLLSFYQELGTRIGLEIAADPHIDLSKFGELIHTFDVLHKDEYVWHENEHPTVLRFAPDGSLVPSIVHAGVHPNTDNFPNLFSSIIDMSNKFFNMPRDFIATGRLTHQMAHRTSPSTIYFGHMMYNIVSEMKKVYSTAEILQLFRRPKEFIKWIK